MDSSKRHWPSMFKTKPPASRNSHHHQWDINPSLISSSTTNHRPSFTSSVTEERSPEPKPRWNPKPEQIRILEAIFNSGTVNPPRDEIRRIRAQLQEYGQVGDANVFYWFQNRKSRSKNKQPRNTTTTTTTTKSRNQHTHTLSPLSAALSAVAYSSSSSSDNKSSQKSVNKKVPFVLDGLNSPTCSVNQPSFSHTPTTTTLNEFLPEPYFFPVNQSGVNIIGSGGGGGGGASMTQGFGFPELLLSNDNNHNYNVVVHGNNNGPADDQYHHHQSFGNCSTTTSTTATSVLFTELMNLGAINCYKKVEENDKINNYNKVVDDEQQQQQLITSAATLPQISAQTILPPTVSSSVMSTINHIQDLNDPVLFKGDGAGKSTVFINDVVVEVTSGPFNVREAFGDDVVLIHSSGLPVATNEWGVTLQSLQHGAFYYLVRLLSPPPQLQTSFQLI